MATILNGMRHTVYVDESLTILQWEPLQQPRLIFEAFKNTSQL